MKIWCDYVLIPAFMVVMTCLGLALHDTGYEMARLKSGVDALPAHGKVLQQFRAEARMFQNDGLRLKRSPQDDVLKVVVTAYTPTADQTDEDPLIAASMRKVRLGTVAVSRDLFDQGWVFGKKIRIEGLGIYEINDLMNQRYTRCVDVFMWDQKEAQAFGKRQAKVALLSI